MRRAALLLAAAAVGLLALRPAAALPFGPPGQSLTWSPRPETPPGVLVTFTIDAFDPDGPVTGGKLEYGDGSHESFVFPHSAAQDATSCVVGDRRSATLRHIYAARGSYVARLTVYGGSCPGAALIVPGQSVVSYPLSIGDRAKPAAGA